MGLLYIRRSGLAASGLCAVPAQPRPDKAEYRNLMSMPRSAAFWIAAMAFDTLPSVLLAVMLTMDKVIVGGRRFGAKTTGDDGR